MVNLKTRSTQPEIMDDFQLPSAEIDPVLAGLAKINRWFGAHQSLIKALKNFPVKPNDAISDWGCGGGDTLIALRKWSGKNGLGLQLTGVDAASAAIRFAKENSTGCDIDYIQADVLSDQLKPNQFDLVYSGLFSHHFQDEKWIHLIKTMHSCARRGVIITDLHRHRVLYYAVVFITHVLTTNKMVRVDGPLSVKRSFKRRELEALLKAAQIDNYKLTWVWPFRWLLVLHK